MSPTIRDQFSSVVFVLMNHNDLYDRCVNLTPPPTENWKLDFQDKLINLMLKIEKDSDITSCAAYWCTIIQFYHLLCHDEQTLATVLLMNLFPWLQIKINQHYMNKAALDTDDAKLFVATSFAQVLCDHLRHLEQNQTKGEIPE